MSVAIFSCRRTILALAFVISVPGCATGPASKPDQVPLPSAWAERCADWDGWDKAGPPFAIFGDTYYVGTCGISAVLITGDVGHVLIDGGTEAGADMIAANIEALGFQLTDVKLLLHSHEHFDHVAGLARLQQLSGARLLASAEAAPVLRTGIAAESDPQVGMLEAFPPSRVDEIVKEGEIVRVGDIELTPVATPGHTPGALSWQWQSCEDTRCLSIVYADSLSPISSDSYHFSDHPAYVNDYRGGLSKLAALDCAVLLTPHPSASDMRDRLLAPEGLVGSKSCKSYADEVEARLEKRLINEAK